MTQIKRSIIFLLSIALVMAQSGLETLADQQEEWRAPTKIAQVQIADSGVNIKTEGAAAKYKTFSLAEPPKIVVEFQDAWVPFGLPESVAAQAGQTSDVLRVRVAQFASAPMPIVRVVIDLIKAAAYQTRQAKNMVSVALEDSAKKSAPETTVAGLPAADALDVRQPSSGPAAAVSEQQDILANLPKAPIDVNFQELDIRMAFAILMEQFEDLAGTQINLLFAEDISGTVTLELNQVPFDEALRTVLSMRQLTVSQVGSNIVKVMGQASYLAEKQRAITQTRIFVLNYITAAEMKTHLDTIRTLEGRKGNILIAPDINSLIVTDTEEGLMQTAKLIKDLDIRPKAVSIETKVIDLQIDKALDYGIEWQYAKMLRDQQTLGNVDRRIVGSLDPNQATPIGGTTGDLPSNPARLSLPPGGTATTALAINFGRVTNTAFLTTALTLAARQGRLKVLSNPKIVTLNNQSASIQAGSQVPTVTTTCSPGVGCTQSAAYQSVGVIMTVKPTITSDGYIRMTITPTVSQLGSTGGVPGVAPAINSRTATTTLIVKDEETAVIGGLITQIEDKQTIKVPILGDLPLIGFLFRRTSKNDPRTELLVFVTPKIVDH
ncbi:MAG: AMIN domain-containing protein [Elusimicrobia bacterium]|nr:AMIN domain-containing protein [Elusimicrobiota bacterium]